MTRLFLIGLLGVSSIAGNAWAAAPEESPASAPTDESDTSEPLEEAEAIEDVEDMQVAAVAGGFLVQSPSGKRGLTSWTRYESPLMTLNLGLMVIGDLNTVDQDAASRAQGGNVPSETELRAGRLMLRGKLGRKRFVSVDRRRRQDRSISHEQ